MATTDPAHERLLGQRTPNDTAGPPAHRQALKRHDRDRRRGPRRVRREQIRPIPRCDHRKHPAARNRRSRRILTLPAAKAWSSVVYLPEAGSLQLRRQTTAGCCGCTTAERVCDRVGGVSGPAAPNAQRSGRGPGGGNSAVVGYRAKSRRSHGGKTPGTPRARRCTALFRSSDTRARVQKRRRGPVATLRSGRECRWNWWRTPPVPEADAAPDGEALDPTSTGRWIGVAKDSYSRCPAGVHGLTALMSRWAARSRCTGGRRGAPLRQGRCGPRRDAALQQTYP